MMWMTQVVPSAPSMFCAPSVFCALWSNLKLKLVKLIRSSVRLSDAQAKMSAVLRETVCCIPWGTKWDELPGKVIAVVICWWFALWWLKGGEGGGGLEKGWVVPQVGWYWLKVRIRGNIKEQGLGGDLIVVCLYLCVRVDMWPLVLLTAKPFNCLLTSLLTKLGTEGLKGSLITFVTSFSE